MPPPDHSPEPAASAHEQMAAHAADAAQMLKALGNEQRLLILCNLLGGPLSVGELHQRLALSQSALSQHLALLREAGFVDTRREAQTIHYSLPDGPATRVLALLENIYCAPGSPARDSGPAAGATGRRPGGD
ncbi:MAG: metalloregulator ArsR/SmtB family transcription factor [Steroidobacteraceae bacterium]